MRFATIVFTSFVGLATAVVAYPTAQPLAALTLHARTKTESGDSKYRGSERRRETNRNAQRAHREREKKKAEDGAKGLEYLEAGDTLLSVKKERKDQKP
ncbi:hypothetical protein C8J56DRAFT_1165640 [Mycena floridula]|nr:hypothetical protein C8J56DRAFT_1165640 [Mycena floridula]